MNNWDFRGLQLLLQFDLVLGENEVGPNSAFVRHFEEGVVDEVGEQLHCFFVLALNRELGGNCVEVLGDLGAALVVGQRDVGLLDCLLVSDVDRVRVPGVDILHYKGMVHVLQQPVAHEVLSQFAKRISLAYFGHVALILRMSFGFPK